MKQPDQTYMQRAIALAKQGEGWVHPNPMVGAVIVKDGRIIGEGYHQRYGQLHAERNAIASLTESAKGSTMYVTLEPCCHYGKTPPCTEAIIEQGIGRVIIGSRDPNPQVAGRGVRILREAGIDVVEDFLREACDAINPVFFHYITHRTPYVIMKYAMTADGKIATRTGASRWITGASAREEVHRIRHACMGIMAGIGTVLADDPLLNCRMEGGRQPIRVICDTHLRIPEDCRICRTAGDYETLLVCREHEADEACRQKARRLENMGIEVLEQSGSEQDGIDLQALMREMGARGIDSVLLEGGGSLNESALRGGIVHEVRAFVAPKLFGGRAKSPVEGIGAALPDQAVQMQLQEIRRFDEDLELRYRIRQEGPAFGKE